MIIIIGLGNPEKKYKNTPHNIGFEVLDSFQKEENFPLFNFSKKFEAEISEKTIDNKKIILVKPQTYMNLSGKSVSSLKSYYKIKNPEKIWVIHDDADISFGEIKVSKNKNSAGHKGVQSIIDSLKTKEFIRFRIGIKKEEDLKEYVLKKFNKEDKTKIKETIKETIKELQLLIKKAEV